MSRTPILTHTLAACLLSGSAVMAQNACPLDPWWSFLDPGPQTPELKEEIERGDTVILGYAFDDLQGRFAKVYLFAEDDGACFTRVVSFGSYAGTNMIAGELDGDDDRGRVYHGDLYEPDSHTTLGFYEDAPSYVEAREIALGVLAPELQ